MNLALTEDQQMLVDSFRRFFESESSMARVRAAEPLGFDAALWRGLGEMGALAIRLPEADESFGLFDAALVMTEAGRHLASAPLAEAIVATRLLALLGGETALLGRARDGDAVLTLALGEAVVDAPQLVPGAAVADAALFLVGDEVRIAEPAERSSPINHGSMPIAPLNLAGRDAVPSRVVAQGVEARRLYLAAIEEWKLLTAAALTGIASRALDLAADYARERTQFGRPIASFQAVAHPLADLVTDVTGGETLLWWAIDQVATNAPDAGAAVSMAWWWATRSSGVAVARSLHTFGGYGVTTEYDIQLFHRRAKATALLLGDPRDALGEIGRRFWLGEEASLPDAGPICIDFKMSDTAAALGAETKAFFDREITPEMKARFSPSYEGHDWDFNRAMGAAGLLFPTWPVEHGGRGADGYSAAAALAEWCDANVSSSGQNVSDMVGHVIIRFGTDRAKHDFLPRLAAGEIISALGYSEPSSGSDVFAARTRAVRDGDDWIIDGQKMFTSGANIADHALVLARTDPDAAKHKGVTLFLVPLTDPGVEIHAVHTYQDERTNATFYSNVRVPDEYRIGPLNGGLAVMGWALSLEQGGFGFVGPHRHVLQDAVAWAREFQRNGRPAIEDQRVYERLANVAVHWRISHLLYWRSLWQKEEGIVDRTAGPMSKLFSSETYLRDATDMVELAAPWSMLRGKTTLGRLEHSHRKSTVTTIYAGTSEVHRSQVAEVRFGFPKSR